MKASKLRIASPLQIEPLELRISPATIFVTTLADGGAGSLREAIATANADAAEDTILFQKMGVIKLASALPEIVNDLQIQGRKKVALDGMGTTQIMGISGMDTDVILDGLHFTRGHAAEGGALLINTDTGDVVVRNSRFTKNSASDETNDARGGAIANLLGNLTVENSTLSGNTASIPAEGGTASGGAIFNAGTLVISEKTTLSKNTASAARAQGGGIANGPGGSATINGAKLTNNSALGSAGNAGEAGANGLNGTNGEGGPGGAGEDGSGGLDGGSGFGGAIYNEGELAIVASKISGNVASGGAGGDGGKGGKGGNGGLGYPGSTDEYGNPSPGGPRGYGGSGGNGANGGSGGNGEGGAIFNAEGRNLTITGSTLSKNTAKIGAAGAAGAAGRAGTGSIPGEAGAAGVAGAPGQSAAGGAVMNFGIAEVLEKTLVTRNSVIGGDASGGGIHNASSLLLVRSVVSGNTVRSAHGQNGAAGLTGPRGDNGERGEPGYGGEPGGDGGDGGDGGPGDNGGAASAGGAARGGGIYNTGSAILQKSTISGNTVLSGNGGAGGAGGAGGNGGRGGAGGPGAAAHTDYEGTYYPATRAGRRGAAGLGGNGADGGDGAAAGAAGGGGIFSGLADTVTLSVEDSTISGNKVTSGTTGKAGAAGKAGIGRRSSEAGEAGVKGNAGAPGPDSIGEGGGIFSSDGSLSLVQSTVAKNSTTGGGGGVVARGNLMTEILNSTIAANKAAISAGGLLAVLDLANHPVNVLSTIIALNKAPTDADVSGTIAASFSLVQMVGSAVLTGTDNLTAVNPKLKALSFHGGPTKVMLPLANSPVIGAGSDPNALLYDQRGVPFARILGGKIDIGAVESA